MNSNHNLTVRAGSPFKLEAGVGPSSISQFPDHFSGGHVTSTSRRPSPTSERRWVLHPFFVRLWHFLRWQHIFFRGLNMCYLFRWKIIGNKLYVYILYIYIYAGNIFICCLVFPSHQAQSNGSSFGEWQSDKSLSKLSTRRLIHFYTGDSPTLDVFHMHFSSFDSEHLHILLHKYCWTQYTSMIIHDHHVCDMVWQIMVNRLRTTATKVQWGILLRLCFTTVSLSPWSVSFGLCVYMFYILFGHRLPAHSVLLDLWMIMVWVERRWNSWDISVFP